MIKTQKDIEGIRAAGRINTFALDLVKKRIKVGMSTQALDDLIYKAITDKGGLPATLGFHGYEKSSCISINDEVCHGIPSTRLLQEGDLVNVDVATHYKGYFADAARVFVLGQGYEEAENLSHVAKASIDHALGLVRPGVRLGAISAAVNSFVGQEGYSVVKVIGGHGTGLAFHEEPWVGFDMEDHQGPILEAGMVFTLEPAVNQGEEGVVESYENDWTILTRDSKLSAQWEVTVLVTASAYELLAY